MDIRCITCNNVNKETLFRPKCNHFICIQCFTTQKNIYCKQCKKMYDKNLINILKKIKDT